MSQSPELAGGEGFTFEGNVAAFYMAAMLAEHHAPGIDDLTVVQVSVQQRDFGEPLDDVIIDFEDALKNPARLSLQVKRSLTISSAKKNTNFRDIILDSWATFKKPNFRTNIDRYGAAVGTVAPAKERALKTLCDWARESLTADHFDARFAKGGNASASIKAVKSDVVAILEESKGTLCGIEEVHHFLAHLVLIQFDFLREGATDSSDAINLIRDCLAPNDAAKASLVWSRVVQLARDSAGKSGQFNRMRLVRLLSPVAQLQGATSFRVDLNRLTELAKNHANLIQDDIGGTKLERASILENMDAKLASAHVVQIRGLPGSGKSVVIRRAVQRAIEYGPLLFLKAEQLEGSSWISYATSQGLSDAPLEQLLVEIGATGTPILFIDAIDRIEKGHQAIILDVLGVIMESSLLDNWRVVVSLRETGIEVLRNWLGNFLDLLRVETLSIDLLNDEEAEMLARAKPHLRALLFGSAQVQEIVRRPFFAKVLNQSYVADPCASTFAPQSEVDLIENWWQRGGYNESGQSAINRQRALIDLARVRARQLSQPISLSQLISIDHIDDLRSDGILQNVREGISVRFAHDIFFEWAFFYVLADSGTQWINEIKICGEPPAVARVVELISQWEYVQRENWSTYLTQTEGSDLRSQWLRAWLIGPFGTVKFEDDEDQFAMAVFADDFRLFRKALVWFQAEKTSPNPNIPAGTLPQEQLQRFADLLSWPSDLAGWRRLINFILRRISDIPMKIYPEIVAIFEVWQNALAGVRNSTSLALLQQCATWLASIDAIRTINEPDESSAIWNEISNLGDFRKSLGQLLLRSSIAEPTFATEYLKRVIRSERIHNSAFQDIAIYSPILAQTLPMLLVEFSLAFLREELPDDQVKRKKQEFQRVAEWRKDILAKPEAERTHQEQMVLSSRSMRVFGGFSEHDWKRLSIHDDLRSFFPPSPLREPFHSLFQSSPNEALRLLRELCNHAMNAWQQLHRYSLKHSGTPIPLELTFPWGTQRFWGTDRVYLWFRSIEAPSAIGCGFMALEEWCFSEIARGRTVGNLIQQVVEGNECIAILGIASMIVLHTEAVTEESLPLFTSQRLLAADHIRMVQDLSCDVNLIGFVQPHDKLHIETIQAANARKIRKTQLCWMLPRFIFTEEVISDRVRQAILNFNSNLPYQYEEHRDVSRVREYLIDQAREYAELTDPKNYEAYFLNENSDQIVIQHVPSKPENADRVEEASKSIRDMSIWMWASKSFEVNAIQSNYTIKDAIKFAKGSDSDNLFMHSNAGNGTEALQNSRGAVAATAAMVLKFREGCTQEDIDWARDVLKRAILLPEEQDLMWSPSSIIPWHHAIYVARGLSADFQEEIGESSMVGDLLKLIGHPLESVSLTALDEICKLWPKDSKLTWAGLKLALSLCHVTPLSNNQLYQDCEGFHLSREAQVAVDAAHKFYKSGSGWPPLSLPPPSWVKVESEKDLQMHRSYEDYDDNSTNETNRWIESNVFWNSRLAAKILKCIPLDEILKSSARIVFLDFISEILDWIKQRSAPPWAKPGHLDRLETNIEWTNAVGTMLGYVAGLLSHNDFQNRLLEPVLALEDESCWAILSPFTSTYICVYLYDKPVVPENAISILDLCLGRLLQNFSFKPGATNGRAFPSFYQRELIRDLMFVSIERADLAVRYVNGDWSEIDRILPLIDRFVRTCGWVTLVMDSFLTLCERARATYPAETFADQILTITGKEPDNLYNWLGSFIPARIAELVQHFAHRDAPMTLILAQKFLRILDILVDMGDRRSAALQLGEAFREIHLNSDLQ
ncbi:hypothetical protein QM437_05620 [Legionella pneumophila]|uniref:hypothetical protein n=1 Tax=Legionella pneumophila TaxID=446 RepID=UPI0024B6DF55|nr:hypothetical protein [Legionella pneumophila]MDI9824515.1 hypothetical protein [Legionella pneumophila]